MARRGEIIPDNKLVTCKNCGNPHLYWERSSAGKPYLAETKGGAGWVAQPHIPHTQEKCTEFAQNVQAAKEKDDASEAGRRLMAHLDTVPDRLAVLSDPDKMNELLGKFTAQVAGERAAKNVGEQKRLAAPKGFTNKYPGKCAECGNAVGANEGLTVKQNEKWTTRHVDCHHNKDWGN